jgi:hypothetical protein
MAWYKKASKIKGFLCDISGVLFDAGPGGGTAIKGSVEAIKRYTAFCMIFRDGTAFNIRRNLQWCIGDHLSREQPGSHGMVWREGSPDIEI